MRILFLSGCAPEKYNYQEPNAYPFYVIQELAKKHDIYVLYFSENKKLTEKGVGSRLTKAGVRHFAQIKTRFLKNSFIYGLYITRVVLLKLLLLLGVNPPGFLVPLPFTCYKKKYTGTLIKTITEFKPDLAVVFPQLLYFAVREIRRQKIPVSLLCTDSISLHFERLLKTQESNPALYEKTAQHLIQGRKLEVCYSKIRANYFFVGEKDKESFKTHSGLQSDCYFIRHHLYSFATNSERNWENERKPLNVLFAGGGHTIYTGEEADIIAARIAERQSPGKESVIFHFLGNGYDTAIQALQNSGYTVIHEKWVSDYDEYMKKIHIQIFPIIMGTGTKAKILSAMSSGLLCVGTWFSFENINATNGEHYLEYHAPDEIPGLLADIQQRRTWYEKMALNGRNRILEEHSTAKVVGQLLSVSPLK